MYAKRIDVNASKRMQHVADRLNEAWNRLNYVTKKYLA